MKDPAASVQARLRNEARAAGEDPQPLLARYGIERLPYRLVAAGNETVGRQAPDITAFPESHHGSFHRIPG